MGKTAASIFDMKHGLLATAFMPLSFPQSSHPSVYLPRTAPSVPILPRPLQYPVYLQNPGSKITVQLPGKKDSSQKFKAEKVDLERQCHQLNQKLGDIGAKRQRKEAERAKLKSRSGGPALQHTRDKINMYGKELARLENERVELESKRRKAVKRLGLIEQDLRRI